MASQEARSHPSQSPLRGVLARAEPARTPRDPSCSSWPGELGGSTELSRGCLCLPKGIGLDVLRTSKPLSALEAGARRLPSQLRAHLRKGTKGLPGEKFSCFCRDLGQGRQDSVEPGQPARRRPPEPGQSRDVKGPAQGGPLLLTARPPPKPMCCALSTPSSLGTHKSNSPG